ncbi:MAG TPA: hypothetical protein VGQ55_11445, partial [Pyrinomonadaceae bacterium]|nr:hypothetical protein [Pyrinomonadaceae bacterium]
MNKRPIAITIIAWLFIAAGFVGLTYHLTEFDINGPFQFELVLVLVLRVLVIVCGVFILRGSNWARWLLLVWIAYHLVLSAFHSTSELAMHSVLLAVVAYFLLRRKSS